MENSYTHAKRFSKNSKIKDSWDSHDVYVQSNLLLLANVFEKF